MKSQFFLFTAHNRMSYNCQILSFLQWSSPSLKSLENKKYTTWLIQMFTWKVCAITASSTRFACLHENVKFVKSDKRAKEGFFCLKWASQQAKLVWEVPARLAEIIALLCLKCLVLRCTNNFKDPIKYLLSTIHFYVFFSIGETICLSIAKKQFKCTVHTYSHSQPCSDWNITAKAFL